MPKVFRGGSISGVEIGKRIGAGAYSCVFSADNYAIKVYNAKNDDLDYFLNEIAILRKLTDAPSGVVKLHSSGVETYWDAETPYLHAYLIFDLHQTTLAKFLRRDIISPADAINISKQLVSALEYVHGCGVIHGDIKPSNILLDFNEDGYHCVLADFGSSAKLGAVQHYCIGTVPFLPPEFLLEHTAMYLPESDIWSLVLTIYAVFTSANLFDVDGEFNYTYSDYIELPDEPPCGSTESESEDSRDDSDDSTDHEINSRLLAIIYAFLGRPPKFYCEADLFKKYYTSRRNVRDYPQSIEKKCHIVDYLKISMLDDASAFAKHVCHNSLSAEKYCRDFSELIASGLKYSPMRRASLPELSRRLSALATFNPAT